MNSVFSAFHREWENVRFIHRKGPLGRLSTEKDSIWYLEMLLLYLPYHRMLPGLLSKKPLCYPVFFSKVGLCHIFCIFVFFLMLYLLYQIALFFPEFIILRKCSLLKIFGFEGLYFNWCLDKSRSWIAI